MAVRRKTRGSPAEIVKAQNVVVTDSEDSVVTRKGTWTQVEHPSATDLTYIYSETEGDYLEFKFTGTGLWLRFFSFPDGGKANASIDGGTAKALDMYSSTERLRITFVASNLKPGVEHTVKVEVTANKNAASTGYKIAVDAFIVELSRGAMQIWAMIEEEIRIATIGEVIEVTVVREKGKETVVVFYTAQVAPAGSVVLLDLKGEDVTLEVVEFATEYDACKITVEAYNATGGLTETLSILDTTGAGKWPVCPLFIHTHESILWYELIYEPAASKFKFGLGYSVRFANGCKISIGNPDAVTPRWINCMIVASVRG